MKTLREKLQENEIRHYVDAILVSDDNKILVLQRAGYMKQFPGKWGFVGGTIEKKDSSVKDAAIREIKEETGLELTQNEQANMKYFDKQGHEGDNEEIVSDTEYWLVRLDSTPEIKISREHRRYEWVDEDSFKLKQGKYMSDVYHYIDHYYIGDLEK